MGDLNSSGSLSNSGTISASINAALSASASTGTASASVTDDSSIGEVFGVAMFSLDGSLVNDGLISASLDLSLSASAPQGDAWAGTSSYFYIEDVYGVAAGNLGADGTLDNNGTISASLNARFQAEGQTSASASFYSGEYAGYVYAVSLNDVAGVLDNSGLISAALDMQSLATATGNGSTGDAYASINAIENVHGLYMPGDLLDGASLDNSGTISATMNGLVSAGGTTSASVYASGYSAYGIDMGEFFVDARLDNSGTISASNDISGMATAIDYAYANVYAFAVYGIEMANLEGAMTNSDLISANMDAAATAKATSGDAYAYADADFAYGLQAESVTNTGSLTNTGTIAASINVMATATGLTYASATADNSYAVGAQLRSLSGTLDNSGLISASNTVSAVATATGNGASDNAFASAFASSNQGLLFQGDILATGALTNSGTISATVDAFASASAAGNAQADVDDAEDAIGIQAGYLYGSLDNSGLVSALIDSVAVAESAKAYAFATNDDVHDAVGIRVSTIESTGSLTNTGSVLVDLEASASADAATVAYATIEADRVYGIQIYNNLEAGGTLDNSGTISAAASASVSASGSAVTTATASATRVAGITMGALYGDLTNSGLISAAADATVNVNATAGSTSSKASASAIGVNVESLASFSGTLDNSGTIEAVAMASAGDTSNESAFAAGVFANNFTGTLDNSGTISGVATQASGLGDFGASGYALLLNGNSTTAGTVNNMSGGLLSGNLQASGLTNVNNSGVIDLPAGADAFVGGDFSQADGAEGAGLVLGVATIDDYADLVVGGTATIDDATSIDVDVEAGIALANGAVLEKVIDAGTLANGDNTATFAVTDNSPFLYDFEAVINPLDANAIDLNVIRESLEEIVDAAGAGGAGGAGALLDEMLDGGAPEGMEEILLNLSTLDTEEEIAAAVNELLPLLNGDATRVIVGAILDSSRVIGVRQNNAQGLGSGDEVAADRNVWGKIFGSSAEQEHSNGAYGYDADTAGLMIGVDTKPSADYLIGAAFSYSQTEADGSRGTGPHSADIDSFQGFLYGTYSLDGSTDMNWQASYGFHDTDAERKITSLGQTARGSYDSWSTHLGINLEREYMVGEMTTITPAVRVDYTYVENDGYTESGAGMSNLIVADSDVDELILGLDGELNHKFNDNVLFSANAGIGFDTLADDGSITAAFAGAPTATFSTEGIKPSEFMYVGGAGLTFGSADALQLEVRYDLEGREDFTNQSASLKLNKAF